MQHQRANLNLGLEGSLLAWIFNPLFVKAGAYQKIPAWTDFAAGGMAVLEDRFFARSCFEFRAFEVARAVDLLYALRSAVAKGTTLTSPEELLAVVVSGEKTMPRVRGAVEGWMDLVRVWNFQVQLARVRSSRGRLWPESFLELGDWIKGCSLENEGPQPGTETSFLRKLGEPALRRFPAIE